MTTLSTMTRVEIIHDKAVLTYLDQLRKDGDLDGFMESYLRQPK